MSDVHSGYAVHRPMVFTLAAVSIALSLAAVVLNAAAPRPFDAARLWNNSLFFPGFVLCVTSMLLGRPGKLSASVYILIVLCACAYIPDPWGHATSHLSPAEWTGYMQRTFAADAFYAASVVSTVAAVPSVIALGFFRQSRP